MCSAVGFDLREVEKLIRHLETRNVVRFIHQPQELTIIDRTRETWCDQRPVRTLLDLAEHTDLPLLPYKLEWG